MIFSIKISLLNAQTIDIINPTSTIDCGLSESTTCNVSCTTDTSGCRSTTMTLNNNAEFNLYCTNQWSCLGLTIYAYNVTSINLIFDGYRATQSFDLYIEGTKSQSVNMTCKNGAACYFMNVYSTRAPNLNFNLYCQYDYACPRGKVAGTYICTQALHF